MLRRRHTAWHQRTFKYTSQSSPRTIYAGIMTLFNGHGPELNNHVFSTFMRHMACGSDSHLVFMRHMGCGSASHLVFMRHMACGSDSHLVLFARISCFRYCAQTVTSGPRVPRWSSGQASRVWLLVVMVSLPVSPNTPSVGYGYSSLWCHYLLAPTPPSVGYGYSSLWCHYLLAQTPPQ